MGFESEQKGGHSLGIIPTLHSSSITRAAEWQDTASCIYNVDGFYLPKLANMGTIPWQNDSALIVPQIFSQIKGEILFDP